jgi:putative membrane protein
VAVVAGGGDSIVGADRSIAAQLDRLIEEHEPDSAVIVIDSVQDERLVPVVESRLHVDAVDRVVVRQAHDLESTYYLLKQFLADEELRTTLLVPTGIGLLLLPILLSQFSPTIALAGLASLLGAVLLYKGLAIDELLADLPDQVRAAMYSGQVSVVTYVVAAGLSLVGVFLGALAVSNSPVGETALLPAMQFTYSAVPWLALAALTASTGRLLDELISAGGVRAPYLNLPFGVVALGLVLRGFSGYFLEREGVLPNLVFFDRLVLTATQRLALFIVVGIVVSLVGVRVAVSVTDERLDDAMETGGQEDA